MAKSNDDSKDKKKKSGGKKKKKQAALAALARPDYLKFFAVFPDANKVPHTLPAVLFGYGWRYYDDLRLVLTRVVLDPGTGAPSSPPDIAVPPESMLPLVAGFLFWVVIPPAELVSNTTYLCVIRPSTEHDHTPDAVQIHTRP